MSAVWSRTLVASALVLCLGSAARAAAARGHGPQPGEVVERVPSLADPAQSYALYLPRGYIPARRWPILYCFDPAARGRLPVERFREAAEQFGWIIAGSNTARNGPLADSLSAAQAMWADTRARLSIDERRVYLSGFSGGARLASVVAGRCAGCDVAGLILYGAGFHPQVTPSRSLRPPVYAAAGADDFNLPEVVRLGELLRKAAAPHGGETFGGGHDWGPSEVCRRAVAWMEAQAMKAGRRGRSENLLNELWAVLEGHARALEKSGDLAGAFAAYGSAALTFEGLRDTSCARREAARLGALEVVMSARQEESALFRRQAELYARLDAHAREWAGGENRVLAAAEFRREVAALRHDARRAEDVGARRLARRVLDALLIQFVEAARSHGSLRRDYRAALTQLAMADAVAPDAPVVAYEAARLHALLGEKGKAAEWLLKALDRGPDDAARLCGDPARGPLCDSPAVRGRLGRPQPVPPPGNN